MPFKALNTDTNELVISLDFNSKLELLVKHNNVICPHCKNKMHCRQRANYALHFVHNTTSENCPSNGESWLHLECKRLVYIELNSQIASFPENLKKLFKVDLEFRLDAVKRVIDVVLLFKNLPVEAHEIQLSPITISELEARTKDYHSQGIASYWYFGRKSLTEEIQQWSKRKYGEIRCFETQDS